MQTSSYLTLSEILCPGVSEDPEIEVETSVPAAIYLTLLGLELSPGLWLSVGFCVTFHGSSWCACEALMLGNDLTLHTFVTAIL